MAATLNPCNDAVFKLLFAKPENRHLLVGLLNAVLQPARPIVSVEVENPELDKNAPNDRGVLLDILAVDRDGTRVDVEMQAQLRPGIRQRAVYAWARLYRDGIGRGQAYTELKPCRVVWILAFRELPGKRFHSTFRLTEVHDRTVLTEDLEIHTVELPKLAEAVADPEDAALADWGGFLAARTDEERRTISMRNPDIEKANDALERLSQDPEARRIAEWREDQLKLYEMELRMAEQKGSESTLRTSIAKICPAFGVELTPSRRDQLDSMDLSQLTALMDALVATRAWPSLH